MLAAVGSYVRAAVRSRMAITAQAANGRPAYDPCQRRVDLYAKAAPVFSTVLNDMGYSFRAHGHGRVFSCTAPANIRRLPGRSGSW